MSKDIIASVGLTVAEVAAHDRDYAAYLAEIGQAEYLEAEALQAEHQEWLDATAAQEAYRDFMHGARPW